MQKKEKAVIKGKEILKKKRSRDKEARNIKKKWKKGK